MQPDMVQNISGISLDPWLLVYVRAEPYLHLEVPLNGHGSYFIRSALLASICLRHLILIPFRIKGTPIASFISPCHQMAKQSSQVQVTKLFVSGTRFQRREKKVKSEVRNGVGEE